MRVEVDFGLCESNAVCVGIAPEVFDLGDDDILAVAHNELSAELRPQVEDAARQCPRQAIAVSW
ncbi:ferredoxin [Mycolicibacterium fluoranthenivorans]|uniref:Ferredoxin n=1 Tax=Mycolicibacterium fluoranthenivorans TaxID=258505 RepID=A0A7X5U2K9_9MYCO|nr:ferredoxin [Mycolicibacterium fluoranthenivorans]MCV7354159.1 ferredoxin [Mycolicibacterium fluoranthenivorans]NIH97278.1 ferredoxin [Mycolicibacterium fluoranthenivorans]